MPPYNDQKDLRGHICRLCPKCAGYVPLFNEGLSRQGFSELRHERTGCVQKMFRQLGVTECATSKGSLSSQAPGAPCFSSRRPCADFSTLPLDGAARQKEARLRSFVVARRIPERFACTGALFISEGNLRWYVRWCRVFLGKREGEVPLQYVPHS